MHNDALSELTTSLLLLALRAWGLVPERKLTMQRGVSVPLCPARRVQSDRCEVTQSQPE